jgi:hypothetical protein
MNLVVPHTDELQLSDTRLVRLAKFLGIPCKLVPVGTLLDEAASERGPRSEPDCLLLNPTVIKAWTHGVLQEGFASKLRERFPHLLIHAFTPDPFCERLLKALSGDETASVRRAAGLRDSYEIASDARDVCGPFSGLSLGPANTANDYVFAMSHQSGTFRAPICVSGSPFMAITKQETVEMLVLGSADTLDIEHAVGSLPLSEWFSRFVPQAMALRYIFREECWHPQENFASFILDDPLLQPKYGYLEFEWLLTLMKELDFATTVAFIPHNYRRNSRRTVELFRRNSDRLAICFHGNDHTAREFVSADPFRLDTMLRIAEARMSVLAGTTGLRCPKVMVFPHDDFSVEALRALKSRNFLASVGPLHPVGSRVDLTLKDLAQPAILRHGGFPLFPRTNVDYAKKEDIALGLFFGRPAFVAGHHDIAKDPEALVQAVSMINSIAPGVRWCGLETAIINSALRRKAPDGAYQMRAYSCAVHLANDQESPQRFTVEWNFSDECPPVEQVLLGGVPDRTFEVEGSVLRFSTELGPNQSVMVSPIYRNDFASLKGFSFWWDLKVLVRRRLSEVRDNYIVQNRYAQGIHGRLRHWLVTRSGSSARQ